MFISHEHVAVMATWFCGGMLRDCQWPNKEVEDILVMILSGSMEMIVRYHHHVGLIKSLNSIVRNR